MEAIVVDSSVAIKWLADEPHSAEARRILDAYRAGALILLAPDLLPAEIGNIVWKKQVQRGMEEADARTMLDDFHTITFNLTPTAELFEEAYRLALLHRRTFYDSLYLALSVRERCRFVTADEKLVNAIGQAFPGIIRVANWP